VTYGAEILDCHGGGGGRSMKKPSLCFGNYLGEA
jgi:hypothetical protein